MLVTVILLSTALLNVKHTPVFADVRVGTAGPYRFLVDTGAQTSLIDAKLAAELNLKAEFQVNVITQSSSIASPGLRTRDLMVGDRVLPETELVFYDVADARRLDASVRGVLGLNALVGLDFTLSPRSGHLEVTSERPEGEAVPFYPVEGRIGLKARMGDEVLTLVLDSGSSNVVLFRTPEAMAKTKPVTTTFVTLEGARRTVPTTWTTEMFFDRLVVPTLPAAIVKRENVPSDGLLPVSAFEMVHVDYARNEVVLVKKARR